MTLFQNLATAAHENRVRFIVIGGHAVNEHGFQRGTEDADIMVCRDDRETWSRALDQLGFQMRHDGGAFLQFSSESPGEWDLDLMLVSQETFQRIIADAEQRRLEDATICIPSLRHLVALKAHALKNGKGLRVLKDMTDVAELLKLHRVSSDAEWLRETFVKYGDNESYERIRKLLA
ncbi:MAG TPA: nucleotidyl transferase AbiEii/AbiGii toxin family protein [Candidatus Acidoferrum sp.]|nr:nucleotidyl transferase AbiEii/AbiGii toxin family protein [Candidatus Acidoferrum sp.]